MEILIILILIAINGFFALSEIAFVSARRALIETAKEQGSRNAATVLRMMNEPGRFLSSMQVGITLIGIISGAYSGVAIAGDMAQLFITLGTPSSVADDLSFIIVVGIVTYCSIVLGELVPKSIALRNPEKLILAVIPVVYWFSAITHPVVSFLSWSTKTIERMLGIRHKLSKRTEDPLQEILGIAQSAVIKNRIDKQQASIIMGAARIRTLTVGQIMVKKKDMRYLTTDMSLPDALVASHLHHHTRYPLLESIEKKVIGYVNFKDIVNTLRLNPANPTLKGICRPIASFSITDSVQSALRHLINTHQHIAIVKDAASTDVGLITMENILESIVGDIQDEYDVLPDHFYKISNTRFVAGGGVLLKELRKRIGYAVPDEARTVDAWVRECIGGEIKAESILHLAELTFEIRKVSRSHIYEMLIDIPEDKTDRTVSV